MGQYGRLIAKMDKLHVDYYDAERIANVVAKLDEAGDQLSNSMYEWLKLGDGPVPYPRNMVADARETSVAQLRNTRDKLVLNINTVIGELERLYE